jgi:mono/diheme cytochrome c family protein
MKRSRLQFLLLFLLLATVAFQWLLTPNAEGLRTVFQPDMWRSPAVRPFEERPLLPSGRAELTPPEGTVARGFAPLPFPASADGAQEAGRRLRNPLTRSDELVGRGRQLFSDSCTPCHGQNGEGDGQVVARGFPAPPSLLAENARNLADGEIFHLLSFGRANMPSYATQLPREERWKAILYVRELQQREAQP